MRIPRRCLLAAKSIVFLFLICMFTLPTPARANIWNLPNGLLDLLDTNQSYNGYTAGSRDAKTRQGKPSGLAVFIMTSATHDELFICHENSDHTWKIEDQYLLQAK